jgi:hypothetical protein
MPAVMGNPKEIAAFHEREIGGKQAETGEGRLAWTTWIVSTEEIKEPARNWIILPSGVRWGPWGQQRVKGHLRCGARKGTPKERRGHGSVRKRGAMLADGFICPFMDVGWVRALNGMAYCDGKVVCICQFVAIYRQKGTTRHNDTT